MMPLYSGTPTWLGRVCWGVGEVKCGGSDGLSNWSLGLRGKARAFNFAENRPVRPRTMNY